MGGSGSRMFVILPAMFSSNVINYSDPTIALMLKISFYSLLAITYIVHYFIKPKIEEKRDTRKIFIKQASFFSAGTVKETTYYDHELEMTNQRMSQCMMNGIMMTVMARFMGSTTPMLMQTINLAFDLYENKLIKIYLLGQNLEKPWDESTEGPEQPVTGEDAIDLLKKEIVRVWDTKQTGDFQNLYNLTVKCEQPDIQTDENKWSSLMILAGSTSCPCYIVEDLAKSKKCNPFLKDKDGWTALHWAAYHNNASSVDAILESVPEKKKDLLNIKGKDGLTAEEVAKKENNIQVIETIKTSLDW